MAIHSSILAWGIPQTQELGGPTVQGVAESDTTERLTLHVESVVLLLGVYHSDVLTHRQDDFTGY